MLVDIARFLGVMKVHSSRSFGDLIDGHLVMFIWSTSKSLSCDRLLYEDMLHQIFSKDLLLYTFFFPRNRAKDSNPNRTFYAELSKRDKTLNGFLKWRKGPSESTRATKCQERDQ